MKLLSALQNHTLPNAWALELWLSNAAGHIIESIKSSFIFNLHQLPSWVNNTPDHGVVVNTGQDPLDALPPLMLPTPISWWPPTLGWWIVAGIFILLSWACYRLIKNFWQRRRRRLQILSALDVIYASYQQDGNINSYLLQTNELLRRCCKHYYPDRVALNQTGLAWLAQLDQLVSRPCLNCVQGQQLLLHYQAAPNVDVSRLQKLVQQWIQQLQFKPAPASIDRSPAHTTARGDT
ncbi:MAG: DUF4381 domain-containing protein [Pseudomonadales bacterium]|nr:DUF4381 domain-containing protein [Pseudomonadales bacterium]